MVRLRQLALTLWSLVALARAQHGLVEQDPIHTGLQQCVEDALIGAIRKAVAGCDGGRLMSISCFCKFATSDTVDSISHTIMDQCPESQNSMNLATTTIAKYCHLDRTVDSGKAQEMRYSHKFDDAPDSASPTSIQMLASTPTAPATSTLVDIRTPPTLMRGLRTRADQTGTTAAASTGLSIKSRNIIIILSSVIGVALLCVPLIYLIYKRRRTSRRKYSRSSSISSTRRLKPGLDDYTRPSSKAEMNGATYWPDGSRPIVTVPMQALTPSYWSPDSIGAPPPAYPFPQMPEHSTIAELDSTIKQTVYVEIDGTDRTENYRQRFESYRKEVRERLSKYLENSSAGSPRLT